MPKLTLFIGKGGVGKTTISTSYAVYSALRRKASVLLISTDPAHSIADIAGEALGDEPRKLKFLRKARVDAWQVNAEKRFRAFIGQHKQRLLSILEAGSIFSREEIEPLLNTTLPGMAEMAALVAISDALAWGRYEHIVVDTAPMGHTLRLFALPQYFSSFLDILELAASRDQILAEHFGGTAERKPNPLVQEWRGLVEVVRAELLKNADVFLVTTPEQFSLNESRRAGVALRSLSADLRFAGIVVNKAVLRSQRCRTCAGRYTETVAARRFLRKHFRGTKLYAAEDAGAPVIGRQLLDFGAHVFGGRKYGGRGSKGARSSNLSRAKLSLAKLSWAQLSRVEWPELNQDLTMVLGKGGVGKTTISAALGFNCRIHGGAAVDICSVDPAPSLDDIFETEIGDRARPVLGDAKFRAAEMDAAAIFKTWARGVKQMIDTATTAEVSSVHLDLWFERQLFSELLESVPPGLDEILAVLRILEMVQTRSSRVLIDMAPTGHALDLLRTPERILVWTRLLLKTLAHHRTLALARDAAVKLAELEESVRELSGFLKDRRRTRVYIVMLAEPLPDRQTERLVAELLKLGLSAAGIFVNRVIFPEDAGKCRRCLCRRRWQLDTLGKLLERHSKSPLYVARNFAHEVAGKKALREFTGELWRLA